MAWAAVEAAEEASTSAAAAAVPLAAWAACLVVASEEAKVHPAGFRSRRMDNLTKPTRLDVSNSCSIYARLLVLSGVSYMACASGGGLDGGGKHWLFRIVKHCRASLIFS